MHLLADMWTRSAVRLFLATQAGTQVVIAASLPRCDCCLRLPRKPHQLSTWLARPPCITQPPGPEALASFDSWRRQHLLPPALLTGSGRCPCTQYQVGSLPKPRGYLEKVAEVSDVVQSNEWQGLQAAGVTCFCLQVGVSL
jgi:hypothetical protein